MKLHGKNILKCISNNVVSQRRSLKEFGMHCYAFCNVVSQRRSLKKEFRMYWFISLLNVCFKIFQDISNAKGEKEGGNEG